MSDDGLAIYGASCPYCAYPTLAMDRAEVRRQTEEHMKTCPERPWGVLVIDDKPRDKA
jgi:hypothetical protein